MVEVIYDIIIIVELYSDLKSACVDIGILSNKDFHEIYFSLNFISNVTFE